MSTKAIREALELVQCTCRDHTCAGCRATDEVEAIERAAGVWGMAKEGSTPKEVHDLMWSIVKEKVRR